MKKFQTVQKGNGLLQIAQVGRENGELLARVPRDQTIRRIVWSPLLSFGILRISPIAMGEEGLRPSAPPPFEKGGRKLYVFIAGNWVPFLGQSQSATCPTAGGEKA